MGEGLDGYESPYVGSGPTESHHASFCPVVNESSDVG